MLLFYESGTLSIQITFKIQALEPQANYLRQRGPPGPFSKYGLLFSESAILNLHTYSIGSRLGWFFVSFYFNYHEITLDLPRKQFHAWFSGSALNTKHGKKSNHSTLSAKPPQLDKGRSSKFPVEKKVCDRFLNVLIVNAVPSFIFRRLVSF